MSVEKKQGRGNLMWRQGRGWANGFRGGFSRRGGYDGEAGEGGGLEAEVVLTVG